MDWFGNVDDGRSVFTQELYFGVGRRVNFISKAHVPGPLLPGHNLHGLLRSR